MLDATSPASLAALRETAIDRAKAAVTLLCDWARGNTKGVDRQIVDEESARRAKALIDGAKMAFVAMEDERTALVAPLNDEVKRINALYHAIHNADKKRPGSGDKAVNALQDRVAAFLREQEAERLRKIEEARRIAEEAARKALEAEQAIEEAVINETEFGVVDTDFGALEDQAERSISQAAMACRDLARAEHSKVRIGGGYGRVMSLRNHEALTVANWHAAIAELATQPDGTSVLPEAIRDAILTCSRAYRKATGDLPAGITSTYERSL